MGRPRMCRLIFPLELKDREDRRVASCRQLTVSIEQKLGQSREFRDLPFIMELAFCRSRIVQRDAKEQEQHGTQFDKSIVDGAIRLGNEREERHDVREILIRAGYSEIDGKGASPASLAPHLHDPIACGVGGVGGETCLLAELPESVKDD